jgi:hypothetical protein
MPGEREARDPVPRVGSREHVQSPPLDPGSRMLRFAQFRDDKTNAYSAAALWTARALWPAIM